MEVRAHLRFLQIAPRKVRMVVDVVRGMPVDRAIDQLTLLPKRSAEPVLKLIQSAVANAEHNFQLHRHDLVIKSIAVNEGPRLKRYRPRAFGRAAAILKRMSHVSVVLEDRAKSPTKAGVKPDAATKPDVAKSDIKSSGAEPKVPRAKNFMKKKAPAETKARARAAGDAEVARKGES